MLPVTGVKVGAETNLLFTNLLLTMDLMNCLLYVQVNVQVNVI